MDAKKHYKGLQILPVPFSLPYMLKYDKESFQDYVGPKYQQILPLMNRDGWYYDRQRDMCWLEYNGQAYNYSKEDFKYEIKILTALERPFTKEQVIGMKTLRHRCSRNDKILKDYDIWAQADMIRNTGRTSQMYAIQSLKRWKEYKQSL